MLVSSLRHAPRLEDLTSEELSDLFQTVVRVQKAVETIRASTSSTVCCQDGKDAGQTIPVRMVRCENILSFNDCFFVQARSCTHYAQTFGRFCTKRRYL